MRSPLDTFAGLLDRSVQEIEVLVADARAFDASRIRDLADIWDNNTMPLARVACAGRPFRARRARTGLLWMAGLGAARRALMVGLDPALDRELPAAAPGPPAYRDFQARVHPGSLPLTAQIIADLLTDYDLACAGVRSLVVLPSRTGLRVDLTVAAPRRFVPGTGRATRDGAERPWPAAPLRFTFTDVDDLRFDAADRLGIGVSAGEAGLTVEIGQGGILRAATASVWPDDPLWYESTAGRAADAVTPFGRPDRPKAVPTSSLTSRQEDAALALHDLMIRVRLAGSYPAFAAIIPIREICSALAGAGSAIRAAGAKRGTAREEAFTDLVRRWQPIPRAAGTPVPSGPALLRYLRYSEPYDDDDVHREGAVVLVAAVPGTDPTAPWRLASEELPHPATFRVTTAAFDRVQDVRREAGTLTMNEALVIQETR
ncbi:hypothetical protein [Actinoplanes regularis]|uniref:hypothetical protein n=1 Tax=Actinoplanes regularis TaxID=52697 RepID=UPI000B76FCB0|nr:hypothetical protein [Actinoplanes regularis]